MSEEGAEDFSAVFFRQAGKLRMPLHCLKVCFFRSVHSFHQSVIRDGHGGKSWGKLTNRLMVAAVYLDCGIIAKGGQQGILFYVYTVGRVGVMHRLLMGDREGGAVLAVNVLVNVAS